MPEFPSLQRRGGPKGRGGLRWKDLHPAPAAHPSSPWEEGSIGYLLRTCLSFWPYSGLALIIAAQPTS